jgi:Holliday junction resolvasome RuvABC ATP-dependent DNA helicase subunit
VKIKRDRCNKNILYGRWKIMFGKKKNNINKVVVSSKEELKTAIKRKEPYIEVQGDLAKKMKITEKSRKRSRVIRKYTRKILRRWKEYVFRKAGNMQRKVLQKFTGKKVI